MNKRVIRKSIYTLWVASLLLILALLLAGMIRQGPSRHAALRLRETRSISFTYEMDESHGEITLPAQFENIAPRTKVVLTATFVPQAGDHLYVKSVYAPLKVFANGNLLYESGQYGSDPPFMRDPPTEIALIPLPNVGEATLLTLEYLSPKERSVLDIPEIRVGEQISLAQSIKKQYGFLLLASMMQLFVGICLLIPSALLLRVRESAPLAPLGLFSVLAGVWGMGESNLTQLLLPYPAILYLAAFAGLFILPVPLLRFAVLFLKPARQCRLLLESTRFLLGVCVCGALVLQLLGIMGLHRSMYLFHILHPLTFLLLGGCILWEHVRNQNPVAKHFAIPGALLILFSILEAVNYRIRITEIMSLFFQIGMLAFVFSLGITVGIYTRKAVQVGAEKARLEQEVASMGVFLDIQRKQYLMLAEHVAQSKASQHDMRHQLVAIQQLYAASETQILDEYLRELLENMPDFTEAVLCENLVVNAVVRHYVSLAEKEGIAVSTRLVIPADIGRVQDSDLSVVIGNLLENAIEACVRMAQGEGVISIASRIQYDTLTIVMNNSFDGIVTREEDVFFSRKRSGAGIGLSSVQMVARKYGGDAVFEIEADTFRSSVYMRM